MENKNYTQSEIDYLHDTLIDLLISTFFAYNVRETPQIGDWCIETSSFAFGNDKNRDCIIGKLISINCEGKYTTETIGGKIINWQNATLYKIPQNNLRR